MHNEPALSNIQRQLLHAALKDLHYGREKLRGIRTLQRYGGQPKLMESIAELDAHLHRLWNMLDGLDHREPVVLEPAKQVES